VLFIYVSRQHNETHRTLHKTEGRRKEGKEGTNMFKVWNGITTMKPPCMINYINSKIITNLTKLLKIVNLKKGDGKA
jgi:hypothetical protein